MATGQSQRQPPFASSSSTVQPAVPLPAIEPNPDPNIPDHFTEMSICSSFDRDDPDYVIFQRIEDDLDDVLSNVTSPLGSCWVDYGTILYDADDDEFDPILHPKVLAVILEPRSIERWEEVDSQIRRLVNRAYNMHSRRVPPFRYYIGGAELTRSKADDGLLR
ncbi:MAG: hypothetical protein LQ339_007123 [Xanthoria mediterranea]|nr:MAG: hypothetical protein LQ339_007123 [Xanthoria mediterranea]